MMMTAFALLEKNPDPSELEIREAISGNLCRCTGYVNIIRSVQHAAKTMRGSGGARAGRRRQGGYADGSANDTGRAGRIRSERQAQGGSTVSAWQGQLYRRHQTARHALHGHHPESVRARKITNITTQPALDIPGVVAVITGKDLDAAGLAWMPTLMSDQQMVLPVDTVMYQMQEVAAVIADSRYAAADGAAAVEVDYEPLEVVVDPFKALEPDAPLLRPIGRSRATASSIGRRVTPRRRTRRSRMPTSSSSRTCTSRASTSPRSRPAAASPRSMRSAAS